MLTLHVRTNAHLNNMVHPVVVCLSNVDSYGLESEAISLLTPLNDDRTGDHGAPGTVQWADVYSTGAARGTVMDTSCMSGQAEVYNEHQVQGKDSTHAMTILLLLLLAHAACASNNSSIVEFTISADLADC